MLALVRGLLDRGQPVVVACRDGPLADRAEFLGIRTFRTGFSTEAAVRDPSGSRSSWLLLQFAWRTASDAARLVVVLRRLGPAYVHSNSLPSHLAVALAGVLLRVPRGWHLREIVRPGIGRRVLDRVGGTVDLLVAVSQATAGSLPRSRPAVLYNPVAPPPPDALPGAWSCPRPLVGFIGRLDPRKGLDELVRAVKGSMAHLVVAGEESASAIGYRERLARIIGDDCDRIHLIGPIPEPWELVLAVDVLVVPSHEEPFGRVAVEGQRAGVAVLAADSAGLAEIVSDEVDGLLFAAGDSDDLARQLGRLMSDPDLRVRLANQARRSSVRFDLDRHIDAMSRLLDERLSDARAERPARR
jgi:glycosyltransferase involved in cell wall biosynthesis